MLSWNLRGSKAEEKAKCLRRVIRKWCPLVVVLLETKREKFSSKVASFFWGPNPCGWKFIPSIGLSGGIVILWDALQLDCLDVLEGAFTLTVILKVVDKNLAWALTGVYGPTDPKDKQQFWQELKWVGGYVNCPWTLAGDFNAVRKNEERSNSKATRAEKLNFSRFIDEFLLADFDSIGPIFTYCNGQDPPTFSRTDKFFSTAVKGLRKTELTFSLTA
ncbi:hypothetical protein ACHQM5_010565 [Ranunculus cassubicifolius]